MKFTGLLFLLVFFVPVQGYCAVENAHAEIEWGLMAMSMFGGLALFLFGMEQMSSSLKAVAGDRMKAILARLTGNRFMGAFTGAFVTAVIQSSSVTTVLVVGFISAGLLTMAQSVGIIMGANIGTTITAQIVAFKVTKVALLMIGIGFSLLFFVKHERISQYGTMLMGLGLVFFGMSIMSDAMQPLRSYEPFLNLMMHMESPLLGILVAAAFTALVQSSSATTGIVIVMASQGFITLPAGIALAFGANIGTCVTAMLASIGKPREAVRAATVHVLFNVAGVMVWLPLIPFLAEWVMMLSPAHPELAGTARLAAETPRQIANAHTIFNFANMLLFIGFTTQIARFVEKILPDRPMQDAVFEIRSKYLDEELLSTPSLALDRVRLEVLHMGEKVEHMHNRIMPAILRGKEKELITIRRLDDEVDLLYEQIVAYMGKISKQELSDRQTGEFLALMQAISALENIGDAIETSLVELGLRRLKAGFDISAPTRQMLMDFHQSVQKALNLAIQAVSQSNIEVAEKVVMMQDEIDRLSYSAVVNQAERLVAEEPHRIAAYTIEVDITEKQKRIYYFAKRMAKSVFSEKGEDAPD